MFLVGDRGLWGYLMCGGLLFCGIFFILVAYACIKGYDYNSVNGEDISPEKIRQQAKEKATKAVAREAVNQAKNPEVQRAAANEAMR